MVFFMKSSNYEQTSIIFFIVVLLWILEIFSLIFLFQRREYTYQKVVGIVTNYDCASFFVPKAQKKLFYQNKYFLFQDQKSFYEILFDSLVSDSYYELIIKSKSLQGQKINEMVEISIKDKKQTIFQILKLEWEGD